MWALLERLCESLREPLIEQLCRAQTIDDVVALVRRCATKSHEPLSMLADCVQIHPEHMTDERLVTLCALFRKHGRESGTRGYAINTVWAAVVHAQF